MVDDQKALQQRILEKMNIEELKVDYDVAVMTDGKGVYAAKTVSIKHHIKDGIITGSDEYGVTHNGRLTKIDDDHVAFEVTLDPGENKDVVTTLENGKLTDGPQTIKGTYKVSRKGDQVLLTTVEERAGVKAVITCKKI